MAAQIIDGAATAKKIRAEVGDEVAKRVSGGEIETRIGDCSGWR